MGKRWIAIMIAVALVAGCLPGKLGAQSEVKAETTLQNPRIVEDSSMKAGQKVTWDCVWFGSYPQTEIVDIAETCGTNGRTWEEDTDCEVDEALYNDLKTATGWDDNGDITYKGTKYRRIKQSDATYTAPFSGYYNWTDSDTYHYFRYDKIKWRVLNVSGGRAFLLADKALDDQKYNTSNTGVTWETSTIRSWLNGYGTDYSRKNFIGSAFSPADQGAILDTSVINNNNINYDTTGGDNTTDKIFLLSEAEVYNGDAAKGYGFVSGRDTDDEARRCKSSTYAKGMGTWSSREDTYRGNCDWWLRSPGNNTSYAADVDYHGYVDYYGMNVNYSYNAVRPALNLNLSSSDLWSYAGTVCSDGTVKEYTVTFVDGQGKTLKTEIVEYGKAAKAPTIPTRTGYTFTGWDNDFSKVTSDLTVTAQWKMNPISIKDAKVILSNSAFTYNGKVCKPTIKTIGGMSLTAGTDYTAAWSNASSKNAGTYTVTITGKGKYEGTTKAAYKINKAPNTLKIKARTVKVKYSMLKKAPRKLAAKKVISFKNKGQGIKTYKKVKGNKKIIINRKIGKVTLKRGLAKGTYKVKAAVKAKGSKNYKASKWKTVTFKIIVQ